MLIAGRPNLKTAVSILIATGVAASAQGTLPPSTPIEIRLTHRIATRQAKPGTPVHAILAAPVMAGDAVLLPLGTRVEGHILRVNSVGLGLVHEVSSIQLQMDNLVLPDGTQLAFTARLAQIEDSREIIDKRGRIAGVRATSTLSHKTSGAVGALAFSNPIALIFTTAASASLLRFSDPEIALPANTELVLLTTEPLAIQAAKQPETPTLASSLEAQQALAQLIRQQPYRTVTSKAHLPSDVTNILLVGNGESILRAFQAAGWAQVDSLDANSTYRTIRSVSEQQAYRTAPMSILLLEGARPTYALAKTLDTFSKRHHLRIFPTAATWHGQPVWVASSTQDIGIGVGPSRKSVIHQIDHTIDHERTKIVNDLMLTGCVSGLNLVDRPWLPGDLKNGTGEPILTDKRMAAIGLTACNDPANVPSASETADVPIRQSKLVKITRQTNLTPRNMFLRDNIAVTGYSGIRSALGLRHPSPPEQPLALSSIADAGQYSIQTEAAAEQPTLHTRLEAPAAPVRAEQVQLQQPRFTPYTVELGIHGGYAGYAGGNGAAIGYLFIPDDLVNNHPILLALGNEHSNGWTLGASVTLNTRSHFSHELSFDYNRTGFTLQFADLDLTDTQDTTDPATQRQFAFQEATLSTTEVAYGLQYHLRPRTSRWRPYLSAGPSLRLMHLTEAPITRASPWFKLGLSTVGSLTAAYHFGTTPPLEGGGIFQPGIHYGAGIKFRAARHILLRADYKETLTAQPDFWSRSKNDIFDPNGLPDYRLQIIGPIMEGTMRQQRATMGVSFVF